MKDLSVKDLVLMAFYVALFMVLDIFVNTLGFLQSKRQINQCL